MELFAGVGGFSQGLPKTYNCVGFVENDKYASQILRYKFPEIINYGDVTQIKPKALPDFDLLTMGAPCTSYSIMGKKKGLEDQRGQVIYSVFNILRTKKPKYFIFENVPAILTHDNGATVEYIFSEFCKCGYYINFDILDAQNFSVPQARKRLFLIGVKQSLLEDSNDFLLKTRSRSNAIIKFKERIFLNDKIKLFDFKFPQRSGKQKLLQDIVEKKVDEKYYLSKKNKQFIQRTTAISKFSNSFDHNIKLVDGTNISSTLTATNCQRLCSRGETYLLDEPVNRLHGKMFVDAKIRKFTPLENERLQSWKDNWTKFGITTNGDKVELSDTQRNRLIGNGLVSNIIKSIIKEMECQLKM